MPVKACQTGTTEGGLFSDTSNMNEVRMNDNNENDSEMKTVSQVRRPENDGNGCEQTKEETIGQKEKFLV